MSAEQTQDDPQPPDTPNPGTQIPQEESQGTEADAPQAADLGDEHVSELPRRVAAGDGVGEYVYKRRGILGYARARIVSAKEFWLTHGVPSDEEKPLEEGSITYVLVGTWPRKIATMTVAVLVGVLMAVWVLSGL